MKDQADKVDPAQVSRRSLIQNVALAVGGAAVLGTATHPNRADAAAKMAPKVVAYQDTPKGNQRCDNCKQFEPPAACKVVDGEINPAGWCKVYVAKPAGT
jgi:hypothetical protein